MENLYEILGVSNTATKEEIKKRYRECAKKFHPDKFATASNIEKQKAEEKFTQINNAYSILSDDEKRKEYDKQFMAERKNLKNGGKNSKKSTENKYTGKTESFQEIFEKFTKGDIFGNYFDPEKNKNKADTKLKEKTNDMFEAFFFQGRKKK